MVTGVYHQKTTYFWNLGEHMNKNIVYVDFASEKLPRKKKVFGKLENRKTNLMPDPNMDSQLELTHLLRWARKYDPRNNFRPW